MVNTDIPIAVYIALGSIIVVMYIWLSESWGLSPINFLIKGSKKDTKVEQTNVPESKRFKFINVAKNFKQEISALILVKHDEKIGANIYRLKYGDDKTSDFEVIDHPSYIRSNIGFIEMMLSEKKPEIIYEEQGVEQYLSKHKALSDLHVRVMEKELMDSKDTTSRAMKKEAETRKETRKAAGWTPFQQSSTYRPWRFGQQQQGGEQEGEEQQ